MLNFGLIKNKMSYLVTNSLLNESDNKVSKLFKEYLNVVKGSPILMLEYIVFKNFEKNNFIKEEAETYITENINLFKNYSKKQIIAENEKLNKFNFKFKNNILNESYCISIQNLILEKTSLFPNVDRLHESYYNVLNNLIKVKKENTLVLEEIENKLSSVSISKLFNLTTKKFNEKYKHLTEEEKSIIKILNDDNIDNKKSLFENIKINTINYIKENSEFIDSSDLNEAINKINNMKFDESKLIDTIIELNDLKSS
jgi:hypothetical protein